MVSMCNGNGSLNLPQTNRLRLPLKHVGSIVLRVIVLLALGLFPGISPGIAVPVVTESHAPVEQGESAEKFGVIAHAHPRGKVVHSCVRTPLRVQHADKRWMTSIRLVPTGHRLPNNLMAPLRC